MTATDELSSQQVLAAARRLAGHAIVTPALTSAVLNERTGATVIVKAETLQIGGAFKFRGAYNRLSQLTDDERTRGVVAWSSGNHAQGVAAAAQRLRIRAVIVMPNDAPAIKIQNTLRFGAEIVHYDRYTQDREQLARGIARDMDATVVPPYDDPHIIAGQGTTALELATQTRTLLNRDLDIFMTPCGGGGLTAGCALALSAVSPRTQLYCVEPEGFDDTARSLKSGQREANRPDARTICDSLMPPRPGELTFAINRERLAGGLVVSDDEVMSAIAFAWRELKLVVEPGGAVALTALLHSKLDCRGKTVGIVLSGGNVDADLYRQALARE